MCIAYLFREAMRISCNTGRSEIYSWGRYCDALFDPGFQILETTVGVLDSILGFQLLVQQHSTFGVTWSLDDDDWSTNKGTTSHRTKRQKKIAPRNGF